MSRVSVIRSFLAALGLLAAPAAALPEGNPARPNILLITADDLGCDYVGAFGCKVPGITPAIDRLAAEGIRFTQAHVTAAICQPSRSALMTGRYPHRSGALGFDAIGKDVPTLGETLRKAGYLNGILAKERHLAPPEKFCWDVMIPATKLGDGRDPDAYHDRSLEFFGQARKDGRPFFLMANVCDPHRPFAGGKGKNKDGAALPPLSFKPADVLVPGFLPDLPDVRTELAQYMASVSRCDASVAGILKALEESGMAADTLVMFLSDNGMPFPFAKTNCYRASTRTPWIVRWPGTVKPGSVDDAHFISGIDFLPTALAAAGLPPLDGVDGRSFLPLLKGERQEGRDAVVTFINSTAGDRNYPMRAIHDRRHTYIFNAWSDGKAGFKNESMVGLAWSAMEKAAPGNPAVAARVGLFRHRVPEEFYDCEADPWALENLIDDPAQKEMIDALRDRLLTILEASGDPVAPALKARAKR